MDLESVRTESWTREGRTAIVDVQRQRYGTTEVVVVAYELLDEMLSQLGYVKAGAVPE